jgi:hypothetical protein
MVPACGQRPVQPLSLDDELLRELADRAAMSADEVVAAEDRALLDELRNRARTAGDGSGNSDISRIVWSPRVVVAGSRILVASFTGMPRKRSPEDAVRDADVSTDVAGMIENGLLRVVRSETPPVARKTFEPAAVPSSSSSSS